MRRPPLLDRRVCLGILPLVIARLQGVEVVEGDALEWVRLPDGPKTLHYCDPPYLWATRTGFRPYRYEMSDEDHRRLLEVIDAMAGKVVLSGYPSPVYDQSLEGWSRETTVARCHSYSRGHRPTRIEVLWMSYGRG